MPLAALRFIERGQTGPIAAPAAPLFAEANLIIGWIAVRTLLLAISGTTSCPTTATEPLDRRSWGRPQRPEENRSSIREIAVGQVATGWAAPALWRRFGRTGTEPPVRRKGASAAVTGRMDHPTGSPGAETLDPPVGSVRFGDLKRTDPISRRFGGDRGTPLDRYYVEGFLSRHAADIRGRVLEIGEDLYTRRFGGDRVGRSEVLDVDASNPNATYVADLTDCPHVPSESFDCLILTQTLHMIYDVRAVLRTARRILAPRGVVLATIPGISQIDCGGGRDTWFWHLTPRCARLLFEEAFPPGSVQVEPHGNVLAAVAFLHGLALEEMDARDLDVLDPFYPVITGVRAVKPSL